MSGRRLFFRRLSRDWVFQWKTLYSVADWTIWVYLIIPALVISASIYWSWWTETPDWVIDLPLSNLLFGIYLFCWIGSLRSYLEEADQLFLLQYREIVTDMKKWALVYSVTLQFIGTFLIFLIAAPLLLLNYSLSWFEIFLLALFYSSTKVLVLYINMRTMQLSNSLLKAGVNILVFIIFGYLIVTSIDQFLLTNTIMFLALIFVSFAVSIIFIRRSYKSRSQELLDIAYDREQKLKYIRFILMTSEFVPKEPSFNRKRPWLFRKSGRIYKSRTVENGLLELFIKVFIRNTSHMFSYLQIVGVSTTAIFVLPPIWMKVLIYVLFMLFSARWTDSIWTTITTRPLIRSLVRTNGLETFHAKKRAMKLFLWPAYGLVAFFLMVSILITKLFDY